MLLIRRANTLINNKEIIRRKNYFVTAGFFFFFFFFFFERKFCYEKTRIRAAGLPYLTVLFDYVPVFVRPGSFNCVTLFTSFFMKLRNKLGNHVVAPLCNFDTAAKVLSFDNFFVRVSAVKNIYINLLFPVKVFFFFFF